MENSIVEKLRARLESGISDECHALYLLIEVRKLIEHDCASGHSHGWKDLSFYCNWAAHTELTRAPASDVVRDVDGAARAVLAGRGYDPMLAEVLSLRALRNGMREMFEAKGLPTALCEPDQWRKFLMCFSQITSDCPCRFASSDPGLDYCDRVEPAAIYGVGRHTYRFAWKLFKNEQQVYEWQFPVDTGDGAAPPSTFIEVGPAPKIHEAFAGKDRPAGRLPVSG